MNDVWLQIERQRRAVKRFWQFAGGFAVLIGSFFTTLVVLDWINAPAPMPSKIKVLEATYGPNCMKAAPGNATVYAAKICDAASRCTIPIDVTKMGDPAQGCWKEFVVKFGCLPKTGSRTLSLPGEANGSTLLIDCDAF